MKRSVFVALCVFVALIAVGIDSSSAATEAQAQDAAQSGATQEETKPQTLNAEVRRPDDSDDSLPKGDANISQLLRLWGVFGEKIETDCNRLHIGALNCLAGRRGTLETLERFNRPAILVLRHDGHSQHVLITGLSKKDATVSGANGARHISRKRLSALWTGRYELIWRTDAGAALIYPGMRSSAVAWLRGRLALAEGETSDTQQTSLSRYFGSVLESRVRNFQMMHGLKPDGIVGPRTQIVLNGMNPGAGAPTLSEDKE